MRSVARPLQLDLESVLRHDREEPVAVGDAERLQGDRRPAQRPRQPLGEPGHEQDRGEENPAEHDALEPGLDPAEGGRGNAGVGEVESS